MSLTLIQKYITYTQKHEAPEDFHRWTAITCIGAAIGRKIYLDRGFYQLFPGQMMVVLVGGSAVVRKSTCVRIGANLLKEAQTVDILSGKASPEAFLDSLMLGTAVDPITKKVTPRDSHVLVFAPELSSFLSKQAYTEALLPILTDLSDAPNSWIFKTRGKGEVVLRNVCLGFLAASTPDWLADAIPPNAFGGGFMSRIIFVYQEKTGRRNPMPMKADFERALESEIITELKQVGAMRGEMKFTSSGENAFRHWYDEYMNTPAAAMDGYFGRRADHLLRTAMIHAVSRGSYYHLDAIDLSESNDILVEVEKGMPMAFAQIGTSPIAKEQSYILQTLIRGGGNMTINEITRACWRRADFNSIQLALQTLKVGGFVVEDNVNGIVTYQVVKEDKKP